MQKKWHDIQMGETTIQIAKNVHIRLSDIDIKASRSSGPGGQHANKSNTRIQVFFDLESAELPEDARVRLLAAVDGHIITAVSQDSRSQARNVQTAVKTLQSKLSEALVERKKRIPTTACRLL